MLARSRENRKTVRRPARRGAQIIIATHVRPLRCVLYDISDGGARLGFADRTISLPHSFTLALYRGSVRRECEMVWVDERFVGVKFISKWCTETPKTQRDTFNSAGGAVLRPSREVNAERTR